MSMPSYADEYAARQAAASGSSGGGGESKGGTMRKGPVRLTISRGEFVIGPDGEPLYEEKWEEEEMMETELVSSVDEEYTIAESAARARRDGIPGLSISADRQISLAASLQHLGGALLVLDTNSLLSALPLLMTLFSQCLARNAFALENQAFERSPISLIVPHTVLSELDALKSARNGRTASTTSSTAQTAQRVNRWILDSLRHQKKTTYCIVQSGVLHREVIPESAWAMHVENSAHASARSQRGPYGGLSPDEEIVQFCVSLQREARLPVFFCSDDVNARLRAEAEGLASFSLTDMMRSLQSDGHYAAAEALQKGAADLIEQWDTQVQIKEPSILPTTAFADDDPSSSLSLAGNAAADAAMDEDLDAPMSPPGLSAFCSGTHHSTASPPGGRAVGDSVYAKDVITSRHKHSPSRSPPRSRRTATRSPAAARRPINKAALADDEPYHYPAADRSSASSRWALPRDAASS